MAWIDMNFNSTVLELNTSVNIFIPDQVKPGETFKVLYLLHGYMGDFTDWLRFSSLERYLWGHRLMVVMPSNNNSYYTDMDRGLDYFTYMTEELPKILHGYFPISLKREDHYIAGLSMGGFGALKIGLSKHDYFSKAASLSGAVDLEHIRTITEGSNRHKLFIATFGEGSTVHTDNDLRHIILNLKKEDKEIPDIYIACGKDDFLFQDHLDFKAFLEKEKINHVSIENEGTHDWAYWDKEILSVLDWIKS